MNHTRSQERKLNNSYKRLYERVHEAEGCIVERYRKDLFTIRGNAIYFLKDIPYIIIDYPFVLINTFENIELFPLEQQWVSALKAKGLNKLSNISRFLQGFLNSLNYTKSHYVMSLNIPKGVGKLTDIQAPLIHMNNEDVWIDVSQRILRDKKELKRRLDTGSNTLLKIKAWGKQEIRTWYRSPHDTPTTSDFISSSPTSYSF